MLTQRGAGLSREQNNGWGAEGERERDRCLGTRRGEGSGTKRLSASWGNRAEGLGSSQEVARKKRARLRSGGGAMPWLLSPGGCEVGKGAGSSSSSSLWAAVSLLPSAGPGPEQ